MATKRNGKSTPSGMSAGPSSDAEDRRSRRAEAVAQMKQAQAARERRSRLLMAGGVVVALLVIVAAVVVVSINHKNDQATATTAASGTVISGVTGVSAATFDKVGIGGAQAAPKEFTGQPALTKDGKPQILYVGAEYCPFCAAERWSLVAALSRFGTFKDLGQTESGASPEVYPKTQTLSFHGSSFTSQYLTFTPYEIETNTDKPLDKLSGADAATEKKYNYPPYVSGDGGAIPFIDMGNRFISSGATYDPAVLKGMSHEEIAQAMQDPSSDAGKAIDGSANLFTAAICQLTDNQPSNVCSSSGVQTALKALQGSKAGS